MGIKLSFDYHGNVELPTLVLAHRNGDKIGQITNISGMRLKDSMSECPEISFSVNKYFDMKIVPYWDDIKDFRLVWCKEWDTWFEMQIDLNQSDEITKNATLRRLGEAELGQIKVYGLEVNTEKDILRVDYVQPSLFYNEEKKDASLLHRLLDKAPHYSIAHVDEHLKSIQRIYSFNDKSIAESLTEIAEDMDVLFVYDSTTGANGKPKRAISVYDLKSYCRSCGARGDFTGECLNCGKNDISEGYGEDTTILVSREALGDEITVTVNHDEVKNCYRLEGGDDLMTATIMNCNPNGSNYMWQFSDQTKEDMTDDMVAKLEAYQKDYDYYKDKHVSNLSNLPLQEYNTLVSNCTTLSGGELTATQISSIVGYKPIMQHYYDTIDMKLFLESGLLPIATLQDTTAKEQAELLTSAKLSPVAIVDINYLTLANASTAVLNTAKIAADPRYQIKIKESALNGSNWEGVLTVTNYSDEKDTYDTARLSVTVTGDYQTYVNQKLKKTLYNETRGAYGSITYLMEMSTTDFAQQMNYYNLNALNSLNTCFTECISLLSEQGITADLANSDKDNDKEVYANVYAPVASKVGIIQAEVAQRESEIALVQKVQNALLDMKKAINVSLDLELYLGDEVTRQLKQLEVGGNVNLTLRPQIDSSLLNAVGWDAGEGTATVFSSTYSNEDGTVASNFTPIKANPNTGEYLGVLSPDELQMYAEEVISGTRTDDFNLQIGSMFIGSDAIAKAEEAAERIHELQEVYYMGDNDHSSEDWITFCAYRREETYSNSNYISDYLNNKQMFDRAEEFLELAEYEIFKSANYKHEITSSLKNLMVIPQFKALYEHFACGNWIRVMDDDGQLYKLRMLDYEIDFDSFDSIGVTFSDVRRTIDGMAPIKEIIMKSSDIINNYNSAINKTNSYFERVNDSLIDVQYDSKYNSDLIFSSNSDMMNEMTSSELKMTSKIEQTESSILAQVASEDAKLLNKINVNAEGIEASVKTDSLITSINLKAKEQAIEMTAGTITIDTGNFKLDADGNVTLKGSITSGSTISGATISGSNIISNLDGGGLTQIQGGIITCTAANSISSLLIYGGMINSFGSDYETIIEKGQITCRFKNNTNMYFMMTPLAIICSDGNSSTTDTSISAGQITTGAITCTTLNGSTPITTSNVGTSHTHNFSNLTGTLTSAGNIATSLGVNIATGSWVRANFMQLADYSSWIAGVNGDIATLKSQVAALMAG